MQMRQSPLGRRGFDPVAVESDIAVACLVAGCGKSNRKGGHCAGTHLNGVRVFACKRRGQCVAATVECGCRRKGTIGQQKLLLAVGNVEHLRLRSRTVAFDDVRRVGGIGYGREDAHNGNRDHQFNQREPVLFTVAHAIFSCYILYN